MKGAGVEYQGKRYITHTTLPASLSALETFTWSQKLVIAFLALLLIGGLFINTLFTLQLFVGVISVLYFADTVFNLTLTLRSLHKPNEISVKQEDIDALAEKDLPIYSILCPLYKEAHVVPQFVQAIEKIDWPKEKLDVMLLLEEDDIDTIATIEQMNLPSFIRSVIVPHSFPKTKPKACNYGLAYATGEYLVIYDAEDVPDPLQLKKAYLGFQKVPKKVACLQAKLNYYNTRQNVLTRFFTAEYSLWFDLTLTGLQSFNSSLPLGGTSNHFRTNVLRDLEGWDPFNVTEDADLGIRLFKRGFKTAIIDSTTYEEATSNMKNWIRQRSRWIKGYMQTYLVHMRTLEGPLPGKGFMHNFIFQLTVGGKLLFLLLNPIMWVITLLYFIAFPIVGPTIEIIYKPPISYIAVFSWIFGNFLFLYYYMLGCAKRNQWDLMKYVFMIPFYWGMMSVAGMIALYQLILKPHYWEKTTHGMHLNKDLQKKTIQSAPKETPSVFPTAYASTVIGQKGGSANVTVKKQPKKRFSFFSLWQVGSIGALLTFDIFLAELLLPAHEIGVYILLSVTAKAIAIIAQTIAYMFARNKFYTLIFLSFLFQWICFVAFGLEANAVIPSVLGDKLLSIIPYAPFYFFAVMCYAIGSVLRNHHAKKKSYALMLSSLILIIFQSFYIALYHNNLDALTKVIAYLASVDLMLMLYLHGNKLLLTVLESNLNSFFGVFNKTLSEKAWKEKKMKILIFNWRDTKHAYAGGAEVYVHELAKRWVKDGNQVTMFSGNDNHSAYNEKVDGVEIVRRGGTYTVYFFAFLYYILKFRSKYDVIIDCENGIPFFTRLYSRRPVILLIHHVHQDVFRTFLQFPLNQIAAFLEGKVMPFVYRNKIIITVSESSKREILNLGFTREENIAVIHNGAVPAVGALPTKTVYPSFMYLGRLKDYKNVDIAIKSFAKVVKEYPYARLSIVGTGEMSDELTQLTVQLGLTEQVSFLGKVSEERKMQLLGESWAVLQPSQVEGWGITVIEANTVGTPVIASRVNGLQDSVVDGNTGILVSLKNVDQFSEAMKLLINDTDYRLMLSQNAVTWAANFDWDKSANDFYSLIGKSFDVQLYHPSYLHTS